MSRSDSGTAPSAVPEPSHGIAKDSMLEISADGIEVWERRWRWQRG